jgi:hypothetical protein
VSPRRKIPSELDAVTKEIMKLALDAHSAFMDMSRSTTAGYFSHSAPETTPYASHRETSLQVAQTLTLKRI